TDVMAEVNAGTGWINHAGHSNYTTVMGLGRSSITTENFTNDGITAGFPVNYTYGCYAGAFDMDDAIAELMVTIETFAAAMLCHSRYGWFTEGTTNGPSHHFQREFFDAVFSEDITVLGDALVRAKDETAPFLDLPDEYEPGAHRWCYYCLNLLGDPAMDAWTDTIEPIYASHSAAVGRYDDAFYVDAAQPDVTAALYAEGTCFGRGVSGLTGAIVIELCDTIPGSVDSLELTLTAHDRGHYRVKLAVVEVTGAGTPGAVTRLMQNHPNPFNPSTTIRFETTGRGMVDLSVYDVTGRRVDTVIHGVLEAGPRTLTWQPEGLSSGIYFYVLKTGDDVICRKAVLLR
ncbi:MAG TPA: C25 family cysteine peptidase, partial [Candidatus Krumholzibacterium sp.]|nr:C25 family cysteine peptidase [Candidatus Krumholzibacterium sp.]